ncbi:MAG: sugar ABC transporter ATP-binding protein [Rhizobiaceae bacterium]
MHPPLERDARPPVLSVRNMSKTFAGNTVLANVDFDLRPGQIHALVGENGSGKSTFIKCQAGFHTPDAGSEITIGGERKALPYSPADALRYGLGFVHQNLALIPTLSVADNIGLHKRYGTPLLGRIDRRGLTRAAKDALAGFAGHIDPAAPVNRLAQADKTLVAIARGLATAGQGRKILVLDEPTAALPVEEVRYLLGALRKLAGQGVALIYVSHRLPEVLALADTVTALKDGRRVATVPASDLDERSLAELIVGRSLRGPAPETGPKRRHEVLVSVENLTGDRVGNASFTIGRGEVLGVAGLLGAGRSELGRLVFGAQPRRSGRIVVDGRELDLAGPGDGMRSGIGYTPEDRLGKGGFPAMTVTENLTVSDMRDFWRGGRLRKREERRAAAALIRKFNIRPANPAARFETLSGGNQQKVILARALRRNPRLIVLDEPVQGVDIGSKMEIFAIIREAADAGAAILLIDADFANLCHVADRILVLSNGRIAGEIAGADRVADKVTDAVFAA